MKYDQWKTASPYDNDPDYSEMGCECPSCGSDAYSDQWDGDGDNAVRLMCDDCGTEYDFAVPCNDGPEPEDSPTEEVWL